MEEPVGPYPRHRGDVDDRAVRLAQGREGGHRHGPGPEDVDLEDAPPYVDGRRLDVVVRDHGSRPRIVHEGVEAPPALQGGVHQPLGEGRVRDVALHVERVGQRSGHGLALRHRARRIDDDGRTRRGEGACGRGADPARRSGDRDDAAGERRVAHRGPHRGPLTGGRSPIGPTTPARSGGRSRPCPCATRWAGTSSAQWRRRGAVAAPRAGCLLCRP